MTAIVEGELPVGWRQNAAITRDLGTKWLAERSSALLSVPCALVPATTNYLLNPAHPQAQQFRITDVTRYPFDQRLKQ